MNDGLPQNHKQLRKPEEEPSQNTAEALFESLLSEDILTEEDRSLWQYLTPERAGRFVDVLNQRTSSIRVVLESVHDGHNQAAVLRSCDAFGIQNTGIVQNQSSFSPASSISKGTEKWLDLSHYNSISHAVNDYHKRGIRVYASRLSSTALSIHELNMTRPAALLFGNEHAGISEEAARLCDAEFIIPMVGFVESFNISVAVAVSLTILTEKARQQRGSDYYLTAPEKRELLRRWMAGSSAVTQKISQTLEYGNGGSSSQETP